MIVHPYYSSNREAGVGGFPESSDQPRLFSETLSLLSPKKGWRCGSGAEHPPSMCEASGSILTKTLIINPLRFLLESDRQAAYY